MQLPGPRVNAILSGHETRGGHSTIKLAAHGGNKLRRRETMPTLSSRQSWWALPTTAFVLSAIIGFGISVFLGPAPAAGESSVQSAPSNGLQIGVTHTQAGHDVGDEAGLTAAERSLLARRQQPQNQHIMGWGADNPEPRPGQYQWDSLDHRIDLIRETGGVPVITLCCAPDWMKGGQPGTTDWTRLEQAPDEEHFGDFAELAAQVAQRYPDVKVFQVWNELKGFYDPRRNTWDIEAYTRMYNEVYEAVKAVRPDAEIGGPYVAVESWSSADASSHPSALRGSWGVVDQRALDAMAYWLEHNAGADFLTLSMTTSPNDADLATDPFTAIDKLTTVVGWLRNRTTLPIWVAEWYPLPEDTPVDPEHQNAIFAASLISMIEAGVSTVLLWGPQGGTDTSCRGCLWTVDGERSEPTPLFASVEQIAAVSDGTVTAVDTTGRVRGVTSTAGGLLVNTAPRQSVVRHDGTVIKLGPYETRTPGR